MKIETFEEQGVFCFKIEGRLDAVTSEAAEKQILDQVRAGSGPFLFDIQAMEYISSAGLRVLLATAKEIKRSEGRFALCAPNPNVRNIFQISGFASFFPITDTFEDGLKQLTG
ncbi:MAG: STAS domain-containing protein [Desulfobacterales bacterium]|nr:STAS domain-containing protein [Desulfobacterales bacterium]